MKTVKQMNAFPNSANQCRSIIFKIELIPNHQLFRKF